jgi:hypothetical protein
MKNLLVEYRLLDKVKVINEGTGDKKKLKVKGRFQKCDEQNNNGRIYPRSILETQVKGLQEKINERALVGALDHPPNDAIHLSQASHLITKLWVEKDGDVMGEAEILSTPSGKIVEALLNDGVKIGISSRGLGTLSETKNGKVVNEDFKLLTFDLVSDPSTKGAYPELTEAIKLNSQKAQAIVSKMKQEKILMVMLEQKINEGLVKKANKIKKKEVEIKQGKADPKFKNDVEAHSAKVAFSHHKDQNKGVDAAAKALTRTRKNGQFRDFTHKGDRGVKTKDKFTESSVYQRLAELLREGFVKKANKAKKRGWENTTGGSASHSSAKKHSDRIKNAKSKATNPKKDKGIGTRLNAGDRALSRANRQEESKLLESLVRLEEGSGTSDDKKAVKSYLIQHLQDLWYVRPINPEPYDPNAKAKDYDAEKLEFMKRVLKVIEDI